MISPGARLEAFQNSEGGVEVVPEGEHGDCSGRGRGGSIEEGTAGSRCQRLRAIRGPQHAQAMSRGRKQNRPDQVPTTVCPVIPAEAEAKNHTIPVKAHSFFGDLREVQLQQHQGSKGPNGS